MSSYFKVAFKVSIAKIKILGKSKEHLGEVETANPKNEKG